MYLMIVKCTGVMNLRENCVVSRGSKNHANKKVIIHFWRTTSQINAQIS